MVGVVAAIVLLVVVWEIQTSRFQAKQLSEIAESVEYEVGRGTSRSVTYPEAGPYDLRLGYARIPKFIERLDTFGYGVEAQTRFNQTLRKLTSWGLSPIYREKTQAGLLVLDGSDKPFFSATFPSKVFPDIEAIPPVVVDSLLFVENRELLEPGSPERNPAVEWPRLVRAAIDYSANRLGDERPVPGASTLATQMEKYRHYKGGVTNSVSDKVRQMATASIRAYRMGPDTTESRRHIVVDYLNGIGLAAVPGHGEVIGLVSGLALWYGADYAAVANLLGRHDQIVDAEERHDWALAYKQTLSLLLSAKRPTFYLVHDQDALRERTDMFIKMLAEQGVLSEEQRDAALLAQLVFRRGNRTDISIPMSERKTAAPVRNRLVRMLGLTDYYQLDRLDLTAKSTLNRQVQRDIERLLADFRTREGAREAGLFGKNRLGPEDDPSRVVYSLVVYQKDEGANFLRVQADTLDSNFDVNEGMMLDLGSTAKLRTLVTYLEMMADIHDDLSEVTLTALRRIAEGKSDRMRRWGASYLLRHRGADLAKFLDAALEREYSASPNEQFFTAGGNHVFHNFGDEFDSRFMTLKNAFKHSTNLVFIRLMRDIVEHRIHRNRPDAAELLAEPNHGGRKVFLDRFVNRESRVFLQRFHRRYSGVGPEGTPKQLVRYHRMTPKRFAVVVRNALPDMDYDDFVALMHRYDERLVGNFELTESLLEELYEAYGPDTFGLQDRAYLSKLHPLELWTIRYLLENPESDVDELVKNSRAEQQLAYRWLYRTRRRDVQYRAVYSELEIDAFGDIYEDWREVGFPFQSLVPSYATAIGTSADRPAALAELAGIIANGGVRQPSYRMEYLHFAHDTPYETHIGPKRSEGERVLREETAKLVHNLMVEVVDSGTGRRANVVLIGDDGWPLAIGGKTGTGDHSYKVVDPDGFVLNSRAVSRSGVFVFTIGDEFYGVITAYVLGREAGEFRFTSSLAAQAFKVIAPRLDALVRGDFEPERFEAVEVPTGIIAAADPKGPLGQGITPMGPPLPTADVAFSDEAFAEGSSTSPPMCPDQTRMGVAVGMSRHDRG